VHGGRPGNRVPRRFLDAGSRRTEPRGMVILALSLLVLLVGQDLVALANRPSR
jgi:hypothetical protein